MVLAVGIMLLSVPLIIKIRDYNIGYISIYYFIIMIFIGVCIALVDIPFSHTMQTNIREEYRGRVISLTISLIKTVVPVSYLISGILLDKVNPFVIIITSGIAILIVSVVLYIL